MACFLHLNDCNPIAYRMIYNAMKFNAGDHIQRLIVVSLLLLIIQGCHTAEKRPDDVLDQATMVKTLSDIYVVEEKVRRLSLSTDSTQEVFERLKSKIFEADSIEDSVFRKSLDYYMGRPKELQEIYTALVDSLNLREQRESVKAKEE